MLAELLLAEPEALLGEHDDRAALGRLVGERRELGGLGELELRRRRSTGRNSAAWRLPSVIVPGLVEQQDVHVARGLDRAAGHGEHVALHEPVHPGDPDRREQRADRRRDEGDEQRDQHGLGEVRAGVERRTAAA